MRKIVAFFGLVVFAIASASVYFNPPSDQARAFSGSGGGTYVDPYLITTCEELQSIGNGVAPGTFFRVENDIDCGPATSDGGSLWNAGAGFAPLSSFQGVIEGQNYTISNLFINRPSANAGLFASTFPGSVIVNLKLSNVDITGGNLVGSIAAASYAHIFNVHVSGTISGNATSNGGAGGLVGNQNTGPILQSSFEGTITNSGSVAGGIAGQAGNISRLGLFDNYVKADISGTNHIGGIVGQFFSATTVERNYYAGLTPGGPNLSGTANIGGIGGYAATGFVTIRDSFVAGDIAGSTNLGSILGFSTSTPDNEIINSYFDQNLTGVSTCVGDGTITINTCQARNSDGLEPNYFFDADNQPLVEWDFASIWTEEISNYPLLITNHITNPPPAPSDVANLDLGEGAIISWNDLNPSLDSGLTINNYQVEVQPAGGDWSAPLASHTGVTSLSQIIGSLERDTSYDYRARGTSSYAPGEWTSLTASTGVANNVTISSCEDLQKIGFDANFNLISNYTLSQNIDCSATSTWNDGLGFAPLAYQEVPFTGSFDGLERAIDQLTINRPSQDNIGLFSFVGEGADLSNLSLTNASVTGNNNVGALAGNFAGKLLNGMISGTVEGLDYVGGLVGVQLQSTDSGDGLGNIDSSHSSAQITGSTYVGGLVGDNKSIITKSSATGSVTSEWGWSGGLVGTNDYDLGVIELSFATGDVIDSTGDAGRMGGLVGSNYSGAIIRQSYATGAVTAYEKAGGLTGGNGGAIEDAFATGAVTGDLDLGSLSGRSGGTITNSYAIGSVTVVEGGSGTNVGGFIGHSSGTNSFSFWNSETTNQLAPCGNTDCEVEGEVGARTTEQLKTEDTFTTDLGVNSWDFVTIWGFFEELNDGYPFFIELEPEPEPEPTPTPSPTTEPTPTTSPTPEPETKETAHKSAGSPSSSAHQAFKCSSALPGGTPSLFRIDRQEDQATLWIHPSGNPYTGFIVWYGEDDNTGNYADSFEYTNAEGMVVRTIGHLNPNRSYSFKVQAKNDCSYSGTSATLVSRPGTGSSFEGGLVRNLIRQAVPTIRPLLRTGTQDTVAPDTATESPEVPTAPARPETTQPTQPPTPPTGGSDSGSQPGFWGWIKGLFGR